MVTVIYVDVEIGEYWWGDFFKDLIHVESSGTREIDAANSTNVHSSLSLDKEERTLGVRICVLKVQ